MKRRDFLKLAASSAMVTGCTQRGLLKKRMPYPRATKPNIILIMSDEHNPNVLGCYDNPLAITPNLDELAAGGVLFENCYCNSPLSVPSRLSFTSGKYITRVGAWNNKCWLPSDDCPSIAHVLNASGYESLLSGKMHYEKTRRYGFSEIGVNMNKHKKTGKGQRRDPDALASSNVLSKRFNNFYAGQNSKVLAHDRKVTEEVVDFLDKRQATEKPFFLLVGYVAPHFPLIVPEDYWEPHKGNIPMPEIPRDHLESQVRNYKHLRAAFKMDNVPSDIVRKGRELYYGFSHWLDDNIGMVRKALSASAIADNTIVVYTTDHGENMGEHGLWWKNCMYEHAARVPLIVNWPARWKGEQRRKACCSLVDLNRTLLDMAGVQAPDDWDGDSMLEWLDDANHPWKDFAVSHYYAHHIASGFAMYRTGDYKYVYHTPPDENHPAERELYDLQADPGEFSNLAPFPEYKDTMHRFHQLLLKEMQEEPEEAEQRCRIDCSKGYSG